jgi:hypothetical protein
MTSEDRQSQIDRRFDETFAVFDERMRKEQETASQQRASRGSGEGAGASEDPAAAGEGGHTGSAQESGSGEGGHTGSGQESGSGGGGQQGSGASGDRGQTAGGGSNTPGGGGGYGGGVKGGAGPNTVPSDIPDGSDDDIVARQLREAAMKETDPELRERLWDEYRKYKKSTS